MNIVIDGHSLQFIGGMERVICDLASGLAARGHQVFLFTSDPAKTTPLYTLHSGITVVRYTHGGRRTHLTAFRQQILACDPDVCISSATDRRHWPWCAALRDTGIPLVLSEHNAPEAVEKQLWNRPERLATMASADVIHMLLSSYADSLPDFLRDRVRVVPNAVRLPVLAREWNAPPVILGMGRLSWEKQHHLLIEAFALLAEDFPEWQVHLWGKGPEQGRLSAQIKRFDMGERILLCGSTNTPERCYAQAEIVCLPSCYEGLPGAVLEGMTAALPVVGFAQCPGTNELVRHGVTGLLASEMTAASLASSLRHVMSDAALRRILGENGAKAARAFAPEVVLDAWESALHVAASAKGHTRMQALESVIVENARGQSDLVREMHSQSSLELRELASLFFHCTARANVLVGDDQHLRRIIFQFPWIKSAVHPLYRWAKSLPVVRRGVALFR